MSYVFILEKVYVNQGVPDCNQTSQDAINTFHQKTVFTLEIETAKTLHGKNLKSSW